ncbi:urease accessory protein UreD [Nonomuraea sp. NPDC005983]|uniref:urease accessory protein UreD n=1 Tax=Nonomuraea sp. NPDC005983 TaxID=3155595 RepID=UPI0033B0538B
MTALVQGPVHAMAQAGTPAGATASPGPHPPRSHSLHATARITAVADAGATRCTVLHGDGPFDPRRLRPRGGRARVCVLGAMSAPHNGDRLRIEVVVGPGADLEIITAAATIALPGPTPAPATWDLIISVADDACLHWLPEPLISTAGSDLLQSTHIDLAPSARLLLTERQILGRAHEPPGNLTSRLTLRRDGHTLLDQQTDYGPSAPCWDGPAVLAGYRIIGQALLIDPELDDSMPHTQILSDSPDNGHAVVTALPGPGRLLTAVAPDARVLHRHLHTVLRRYV